MARISLTFDEALDFTRACTADYVDASGATVTAVVDAPRFDHDPASPHAALGLLVQRPPAVAAADLVSVDDTSWAAAGDWSVLHRFTDLAGNAIRRLHYTTDPVAALDLLLAEPGRHQQLLAFAFRPQPASDPTPYDTLVMSEDGLGATYRGQSWELAAGALDFTDPNNSHLIGVI